MGAEQGGDQQLQVSIARSQQRKCTPECLDFLNLIHDFVERVTTSIRLYITYWVLIRKNIKSRKLVDFAVVIFTHTEAQTMRW